jgi:Tfp pilus assembly protein PilF
MERSAATSASRNESLLALGVLLLAAALYASTLTNGFVYDDWEQILQNPNVQSFRHLEQILTRPVWSFRGEELRSNYYRPVMLLGYLFCFAAFGDLPMGYHLVNVLLHVVVVWLVYAAGRRLFGDFRLGLLAAAIFALHPIHTEAVAWIAGVTELELALFYLLALLLFIESGETQGRRAAWLRGGMLLSFTLALLSKESAITFPAAAAAYEHFCRPDRARTSWRMKFSRHAALWVLAAAYLAGRVGVVGGAAVVKHADVSRLQALLSAPGLIAQYAQKLFWPWPLCHAYPFEKTLGFADPRLLAGLGVMLAAAALIVLLWKRSRPHAFALFWIFLTLAPVLNARWMGTHIFAERYLYLPSAGFCWLAAAGVLRVWRREATRSAAWRAALALAGCALAALAAAATIARNFDWRDDRALITSALATFPDEPNMRANLGSWLWSRGRRAEAEREWRRALERAPEHHIALPNLGMALLEKRDYAAAKEVLLRAAARWPKQSAPRLLLAQLHLARGEGGAAERELRRAVEIYPLSPATRNALGNFLLEVGRLGEAAAEFRASLDSIPGDEAWAGLAEVAARRNDLAQAEKAWKEAVRLNPFLSRAHFALGKMYLAADRLEDAKKELEAGLLTDPNNPEARDALARLSAAPKR